MSELALMTHTAALWKKLAQPTFEHSLDLSSYAADLDKLIAASKEVCPLDASDQALEFLSEAIGFAQSRRTTVELLITENEYPIVGTG